MLKFTSKKYFVTSSFFTLPMLPVILSLPVIKAVVGFRSPANLCKRYNRIQYMIVRIWKINISVLFLKHGVIRSVFKSFNQLKAFGGGRPEWLTDCLIRITHLKNHNCRGSHSKQPPGPPPGSIVKILKVIVLMVNTKYALL